MRTFLILVLFIINSAFANSSNTFECESRELITNTEMQGSTYDVVVTDSEATVFATDNRPNAKAKVVVELEVVQSNLFYAGENNTFAASFNAASGHLAMVQLDSRRQSLFHCILNN